MPRRVMRWVAAGMLLAASGAGPVWAQDPIEQEVVHHDPLHKAGRGLTNVLTCWIEVPKNFHLGTQEDNPVLGALWGLVKGAGLGATRLAVGAYEVVTFPVPVPKDYASPYEGMELPDYAWE